MKKLTVEQADWLINIFKNKAWGFTDEDQDHIAKIINQCTEGEDNG